MAPRRLSLAEAFGRVGAREARVGWRKKPTTARSSRKQARPKSARERRKWAALIGGAHLFWLYALVLAAIVLILYFVLR
jgi:hypothetical protein